MLIEDKKPYSLQLFGGVEHGFALRGDQNDPYERKHIASLTLRLRSLSCFDILLILSGWVKEQSLRGIADWFDLWLAK